MRIISIASQKGGCGKSTITTMLASHLAYKLEKKICIIDADTRQRTIQHMREVALDEVKIDPQTKEPADIKLCQAFCLQDKKPYPIIGASLDDSIFNVLEDVLNKDYDVVFIDLPGSIENNIFFQVVANCDVLFIPFIQDPVDFQSNFDFCRVIVNAVLKNKESRLNYMCRFWNRYKDIRPSQFEEMNSFLSEYIPDVIPMVNRVGYSDAVSNSRCRSSLIPPAEEFLKYKNFNLRNFLEEASSIILK